MTNPATRLLAAVNDGADLVRWAEPNTAVHDDDLMSAAVRRGLSGPVPADADDAPLLRFANTSAEAMLLVDALVDPPQYRATTCDRCDTQTLAVLDTLWVPAGRSCVEVKVCWRCRLQLDMPHREGSTLVWN